MVKTDVQVQDHLVIITIPDHKSSNHNLNLKADLIVGVILLHLLLREAAAAVVQAAAAVVAADQQEVAVDSYNTFTNL